LQSDIPELDQVSVAEASFFDRLTIHADKRRRVRLENETFAGHRFNRNVLVPNARFFELQF
jgi:hypothetical protein